MLQRLPITLAQVKAGNTPEKSLNESKQFVYYLSKKKKQTKNVHTNIMNSM